MSATSIAHLRIFILRYTNVLIIIIIVIIIIIIIIIIIQVRLLHDTLLPEAEARDCVACFCFGQKAVSQ